MGYFRFEVIIKVLVSYFRFIEYICYESTAIINILILSVRGSTLDVRIWRLQTSNVGLRTERVNIDICDHMSYTDKHVYLCSRLHMFALNPSSVSGEYMQHLTYVEK